MQKIKTLFILLVLVITTFSLTGCSGGEADYTLQEVQSGNSKIVFLSRSSFIVEKTATPIVDLKVESTNPILLTLVSGSELFTIDQNNSCIIYADNITGANLTQDNYTVIVQAKDSNGKTVNQIISLEFVDDINDVKPQIDLTYSTQPFVVVGDITPFTTIAVYDVRGYGITYSLEGAGSGMFTITDNGDLSLNANTPVGIYDVVVVATDSNNGSLFSKTNTITVTVVGSEAELKPTIVSSAFLYTENDTDAMQIEASTTTNGALVFTLGDIDDSDRFTISSTGALTFKVAPDHENPIDSDSNNIYNVEVITTDINGQTDAKTVMVTVLNIDDGFDSIGYSAFEYWYDPIFGSSSWKNAGSPNERLNDNTLYRMQLTASPQVNGDVISYDLQPVPPALSFDAGVFSMSGDTVTIDIPKRPTFGDDLEYAVRIHAVDEHGNSTYFDQHITAR